MAEQLMLSSFGKKTTTLSEVTTDLQPWNNVIYDWDIEFWGYGGGEFSEQEGHIQYTVNICIKEALVKLIDKKKKKRVEQPGYIVEGNADMLQPEGSSIEFDVYHKVYPKKDLAQAYDSFMDAVLVVQGMITIAESRAALIPIGKVVFECPFCGWCYDKDEDDTSCQGCGKRFWSEKLLRGESKSQTLS
jgi:hypothetical protein